MSDTPDKMPEIDRERVLAAEYSLGLLEGEELLAARGRMGIDPEFAFRKEWWDDWFVPLSDEIGSAEPDAHVWHAIAAQVSADAEQSDTANIVMLDMQRRMRRWQWATGIATAAAMAAFALFISSPNSAPINKEPTLIAANEAPLMASIPIGDTPLRLGVTFLPASDEMLVSAAGLTADGVHDHELWLVPADGSALQSLGVIAAGEERRMTLPSEVARNMSDGVKLVLTREPIGGKPEGVDAGPVVAQGAFGQV